jgi:hypothetical protein
MDLHILAEAVFAEWRLKAAERQQKAQQKGSGAEGGLYLSEMQDPA